MVSIQVQPGNALGNTLLLLQKSVLLHSGFDASALAKKICGHQYDGLLVVDASKGEGVPVEVVIWNRDGSSGGACLNGLRLVARWTKKKSGQLKMDGRILDWRIVGDEVELHLHGKDMPKEMQLAMVVTAGGPGLSVPFWNPHCVVPVADVGAANLSLIAESARAVKIYFPAGANVEVVSEDGPGRVRMRVDERGVGETQACASGAVAVALSAWGGGLEGPLMVAMPGGELRLARAEDGGIKLRGDAFLTEEVSFFVDS